MSRKRGTLALAGLGAACAWLLFAGQAFAAPPAVAAGGHGSGAAAVADAPDADGEPCGCPEDCPCPHCRGVDGQACPCAGHGDGKPCACPHGPGADGKPCGGAATSSKVAPPDAAGGCPHARKQR